MLFRSKIFVNKTPYRLPKFALVGGVLQTPDYEIKEGDVVELLPYYTVEQVAKVMDVSIDPESEILVNHEKCDLSGKVYDNFSLEWGIQMPERADGADYFADEDEDEYDGEDEYAGETAGENAHVANEDNKESDASSQDSGSSGSDKTDTAEQPAVNASGGLTMHVVVNGAPVTMTGKKDYIYVDVFQYIDFDLSKPQGKTVETLLNGRKAQYMENLSEGDVISIAWKD